MLFPQGAAESSPNSRVVALAAPWGFGVTSASAATLHDEAHGYAVGPLLETAKSLSD